MTLPLGSKVVHAEVIKTYASAINKAGRQRMLSQRIVKAYAMIGLDIQQYPVMVNKLIIHQ